MQRHGNVFARLFDDDQQHFRSKIKVLPFEIYNVLESKPGEISEENESLPRIAGGAQEFLDLDRREDLLSLFIQIFKNGNGFPGIVWNGPFLLG